MDSAFHRFRAAEALGAAQALRTDHPGWALVPLFYSGMHLMHARFDEDGLPPEKRHPDQHKSYRDGGNIQTWGTLDVVRTEYSATLSRAYTSLFQASYATRYSSPLRGDGARMWADYDVIAGFCKP